tara:strand:+ start:167 stop:517 length:351 start_codon:yes stop_codon:yes gene_type:complete
MPDGIIFLIVYVFLLGLATYLLLSEKIGVNAFAGMSVSPIIILLIFSLLSNQNSSGWSKTEQTVFIDNCVDGASGSMTRSEASKYCNCVLNDLMEDYDTPEDALNVDVFSYAIECL